MGKSLAIGIVIVAAWTLTGCGTDGSVLTPAGAIEATDTQAQTSGDGRVITGPEALELYGVDVNDPPSPGPATATPQIWFPARAWVEPSVLPYDVTESINFLPMFSAPDLDVQGTWLGDLEADREVTLHAVSEDGAACLVEGPVLQGWTAKGWVACNRLRLVETK